MVKAKNSKNQRKKLSTQQSVDQAIRSICDIMRRGNCAGALQYVPELTWILFLRILDEKEHEEKQHCEALGVSFEPSLRPPYRWCDWAAPFDEESAVEVDGTSKPQGWKRKELQEGAMGSVFAFVNGSLDGSGNLVGLLPYLRSLKNQPNTTPRQKVISEVMSGVERIRIDTERNFLDVLDKVHGLSRDNMDATHVFPLSQVYEGLLLKMGEKANDGGQFFTPRQVIKAMVHVIDPKVGETVYDPGCGTGGFLAQSFEYMAGHNNEKIKSPGELETLKEKTFWGREKENLIYPISLANLILHGINKPNIWHGNTLTGQTIYDGLFEGAPQFFDVVLMNPPFGGKEGKEAQTNFDYKTSSTQALFLQHVIRSLRDGGRCGIVLDEGLLFRTNQKAFVQTKQKLLNDCDLWCIVSLPAGVFTQAGAGVKTNLLFFTKGGPTRKIWYYDLTDVKVRKRTPLTLKHFEDFFRLLPDRTHSPLSWTVDTDERKKKAAEEAQPFKQETTRKKQQVAQLKERLKELKKAKPKDEAAVAEAEEKVKTISKEAKEAAARASEIENAVYDLKAVNPNKKPKVDTRTPEELLNIIETKGHEVAEALATLRASLNMQESSDE